MDINITNPVTTIKIGEVVNGASSATPNDTDLLPVIDTSVTKKLTLTNLKAFLKTYFDTLYGSASATWGGITGTLSSQTDLQNALNAKENSITAGTTSQYWRGDKTFQTLDKSAVGLGNVDNTSDVNKPISTATQTALDAKYNHINFQCLAVNPTDNQNLYLNGNAIAPQTTDTQRAFTFGKVVTIAECYWAIQQSANGDNAQVDVYLRNITTNTNSLLGSFTSDWGAATGKGFVFSGLSIVTSATDYYTIYIDCPTWPTSNPTAWLINGNLSYR